MLLRVSVSTCLLLLGCMARGQDVELESCIDQQGVPGGVVVFVGGDSIDDAAVLAESGDFLVHALCTEQDQAD